MSAKYFNKLNYSLANEDTHFERALIKKFKPKKILSIAGSGGRSLPLVDSSTSELSVVDMANEQLWLVEIKKETMIQLTHNEFLQFWGYAPYDFEGNNVERERIFHTLTLAPKVKKYFLNLFRENHWRSILYAGKWEKTFQIFAKVAQTIMSKDDFLPFLQFDSIIKQKEYFNKSFNRKKWYIVLRLLGNASMFNALLYRGHFVKKNIDQGHFAFYRDVFDRLFTTILVRDNFFLQLCLFGRVLTPEGNTLEAQSGLFKQLKGNLPKIKIEYLKGNILNIAKKKKNHYNFLSFSDVPSYFNGELEKKFMQQVYPCLKKGAIVVIRYYLKICRNVDTEGFEEITEEFTDLIAQECVQVYTIKVYRKL